MHMCTCEYDCITIHAYVPRHVEGLHTEGERSRVHLLCDTQAHLMMRLDVIAPTQVIVLLCGMVFGTLADTVARVAEVALQ